MKRSNTVSSRGTRWLRYLGTLACVFLALFFTMHWWLGLVPLPPALFRAPPESLELLDRNGASLRELPQPGSGFGRNVPLGRLPKSLVDATLAAEDKRFFSHPGYD